MSLLAAKAEVQYDPSIVTPAEIAVSVTDLGFPASVLKQNDAGTAEIDLEILGMTCASCVHKIESNIGKIQGVKVGTFSFLLFRKFGYVLLLCCKCNQTIN